VSSSGVLKLIKDFPRDIEVYEESIDKLMQLINLQFECLPVQQRGNGGTLR
jgi:hypothetical protein